MISIMTGGAVSISPNSKRSASAMRIIRRLMLTTGSAAALAIASAAYAQDTPTGGGEATERFIRADIDGRLGREAGRFGSAFFVH